MVVSGERVHGGPDGQGAVPHDFSANANACGPCPVAAAAVAAADATRYPDPRYGALRAALARRHGVDPERIALAASASEFIFRFTAWAARSGAPAVSIPAHAYGDYAAAALAWGLAVDTAVRPGTLVWACEPSSPLGRADPRIASPASVAGTLVVDRAYEPLRLAGARTATPDPAWELWTPNKALGLTGVRAAYAIAPEGAEPAVAELDALAPSWLLGAHGVALLQAWCAPACTAWLEQTLPTLRAWKARQQAICESLGWRVEPGDANFFLAQVMLAPRDHARLREHGVQVRDCASFGLPGRVRLAVRPPVSQDALRAAAESMR